MSRVERKEYQQTQVQRTVSPARLRSSQQNLSQFDSNLDYLLEDLQNSVSRPGSSLGNREVHQEIKTVNGHSGLGRSSSFNRMQHVKPANPVQEYSSDDAYSYTTPDGRKKVEGYKKESYSYSTSGATDIQPEKARVQKNINQLDSLLDDLQQVKKSAFSEKETFGCSPTFGDNKYSSSSEIRKEYHYGSTPSKTSTLDRMDRERSSTRDVEYISEGQRPGTPSSRTSTLSKQSKVTNVHSYPLEVIETITPDINPEVLAHLDPNLRPPGNTKVTTTIKTYTYEIPGSGDYPTNLTLDSSTNTTLDTTKDKYLYSPNTSASTPSKSFQYNKFENKTEKNVITYPQESSYEKKLYEKNEQNVTNYPLYKKPSSPITGGRVLKESVTTRNYQPSYPAAIVPAGQDQYFYNEKTTTTNYNDPPPQPTKETYIHREVHNKTNYIEPARPAPVKETFISKEITNKNIVRDNYPAVTSPANETYIYKESNITDREPYTNGYGPPHSRTIIYEEDTRTTNNYYPDRPKTPTKPLDIKYEYKTTSTTTNKYNTGYPEREPLLPRPFPTDSVDAGPPKKLDELMSKIGPEPPNSPYNAGYQAHEKELVYQRKVNSLKKEATEADELNRKEPVAKTKNVSGPAVYYPPGEMFSKKEEEAAAWRAQGGYAAGKEKYEYGAKEKSKQKGASGAAIIPVCLPCCCGLPCTII